mgnify:CR=1 FL=1
MKPLLSILIVLLSFTIPSFGQEPAALGKDKFFKSIYKDFLKYGTVYVAGDISNSIEAAEPTYFLRTNPDGSLYSIPEVVDNTPVYPFDYRYGFGIRKLARFNYERKPKNFYDGTEEQLTFSAPTSALPGLEYQFHFEKERWRGEDFTNYNFFIKHTGKHHIVKVQTREVGKINLNYSSAEVRGRLPIGEKFSISAGAILRGHERAYGYNPVEIWLNETDAFGNPVNQWYGLGFEYGYDDIFYGEAWDLLDPWMEIAPIVGVDFYHYENRFWVHAYANYILPLHTYVAGEKEFSYLNRNNWGRGGLIEDAELEQWSDYSFGTSLGFKINKNLGVFVEGEFSKMWDSKLYQTTFGLNYTFR